MDRPIVIYILYSAVSVQQTNLLPENASKNDAIFAGCVYRRYWTTSQYFSSYGCAITILLLCVHIAVVMLCRYYTVCHYMPGV